MAEAITRNLASDRHLGGLRVESAGTGALAGAPASDGAMLVSLERGLDLSEHRSRPLTAELVRGADVLLVMGPQHLEYARRMGAGEQAQLLYAFASRGAETHAVSDPYGSSLEVYRHTFDELSGLVGRALERLVADGQVRP